MKIIAHRGNVDGPNALTENRPDTVDHAIAMGFDAEIDIRCNNANFYLGHDEPQYIADLRWLISNKESLWIHCKNIEALYEFSCNTNDFNYFWHENDCFALTSKRYIWTYPGKPHTDRSVLVMSEIYDIEYDCYGIYSDYPLRMKIPLL